MRTVRDGVFGAIGRRRCTGQCVLGWTRVAPECGAGSALGVPQHSGHGGWGSDASNGGLTSGLPWRRQRAASWRWGPGLYRCTEGPETRERSGCALRGPPILLLAKG